MAAKLRPFSGNVSTADSVQRRAQLISCLATNWMGRGDESIKSKKFSRVRLRLRRLRHLDRCLTCRSCETTCPSEDYGRLADIGRKIVEDEVGRSLTETLIRKALIFVIPNRPLFGFLMRLGQLFRPLMPSAIRRKIPRRTPSSSWPQSTHTRKMLVLEACAQPSATPNVNAAAARALDRLGIQLIAAKEAGCCGAVAHHLSRPSPELCGEAEYRRLVAFD